MQVDFIRAATPKYVLVVIIRGKKKILYHSGLQYFATLKNLCSFKRYLQDNVPKEYHLEFYEVDVVEAHAPEEGGRDKGTWCPYCKQYSKFIRRERTGAKHCEICGISNFDFYVKKYNRKGVVSNGEKNGRTRKTKNPKK